MGLSCNLAQDGIWRFAWDEPILGLGNAAEFRRRFLAALPARTPWLVLDLRAVDTVDSAGIGAILTAMRAVRERGGDLALCGTRRRVLTVFELVGLDQVLPVFPTAEDAVAALQSMAVA